jgi:hypothetical protein
LLNGPRPEGNIVFAAATLSARKHAGLVRASNEWLNDAIPDGGVVGEQHLLRELAIKPDDASFNGNGTPPNPLGILHWPGGVSTPGAATLDAAPPRLQALKRPMHSATRSLTVRRTGPRCAWNAMAGDGRLRLAARRVAAVRIVETGALAARDKRTVPPAVNTGKK